MQIDDDRDLAEQVESALRALGIATTRSNSEPAPRMVDVVSALRHDGSLPRIETRHATLQEGDERR
ncbi:hypothetical protein [Jiella avicenniae]|uniref:Uncharacterized protein n=1 Tax=Jiella avicenniae TaxID=2907202 RepID=A0A9X1T6C3_9HYPH|nr:hypothetical protein [Jiella avicenniae]MCE7029215.1 hypothetical protein [Jiella avicenniae]